MNQYNILVYGAGAVGMFFGGKLQKAGFNVVFVDTPRKTDYLRDNGIEITSDVGKDYTYTPEIVDSVDGLPGQDLILVCVKAYHTYDIALNLIPVLKPTTAILSLQNGLENEKILSDLLGKNQVLGAVPYFNGKVTDRNKIRQFTPARIIFGEMDHQQSEREDWISKIFSHADINHEISRNISVEIWKYFIWNNAFNTISALTNTTLRKIHETENTLTTVRQMMQEAQQVALAEGVEITGQHLDEIMQYFSDTSDISSILTKDIEAEKMPELEPLAGVLIQKAKKHGISVQVNQTVYNLLHLALSNTNVDFTTKEDDDI